MKTSFTFKKWYWGEEHEKQPPQWWTNFLRGRQRNEAFKDLYPIAKVREKSNGDIRVVFNSPNDLAFFILRYS